MYLLTIISFNFYEFTFLTDLRPEWSPPRMNVWSKPSTTKFPSNIFSSCEMLKYHAGPSLTATLFDSTNRRPASRLCTTPWLWRATARAARWASAAASRSIGTGRDARSAETWARGPATRAATPPSDRSAGCSPRTRDAAWTARWNCTGWCASWPSAAGRRAADSCSSN